MAAHDVLQKWMDETGTKPVRLAADTDVSLTHINDILSGDTGISMKLAMKLATVTGIPVENLLTNPKDVEILEEWGKRQTTEAGNARQ